MKQNLTDVTIVLDRSGSMEQVRGDTIGGYNAFVGQQAKDPGETLVSLVQFDTAYEPVYSLVKASDVKPLDYHSFVPRGGTALYNALGRVINELGARLDATPEADRPGKVIVVIITDGEDNQSREFTQAQVAAAIKHQRETYKWDFVFLAANIDAERAASAISIPKSSAMNYSHNAAGTEAAFVGTAAYVSRSKAGIIGNGFTQGERDSSIAP